MASIGADAGCSKNPTEWPSDCSAYGMQTFDSKLDSPRFDSLISKLKAASDTSLLVEHLETAHANLHGGMPLESAVNLELGQEAVDDLKDASLKLESQTFIDGMLDRLRTPRVPLMPVTPRNSPNSMQSSTEIASYFQGEDVSLGTFYPTGHVIVVLSSFDSAANCHNLLCESGLSGNRVLAAEGKEFGRFLQELRARQSIGGALMTGVSRILDKEWASSGCGFVVAFSPTEELAVRIANLCTNSCPLAAHWYSPNFIRSLT
jgi:hypothetical protein